MKLTTLIQCLAVSLMFFATAANAETITCQNTGYFIPPSQSPDGKPWRCIQLSGVGSECKAGAQYPLNTLNKSFDTTLYNENQNGLECNYGNFPFAGFALAMNGQFKPLNPTNWMKCNRMGISGQCCIASTPSACAVQGQPAG